jgi:hypothetical protein
MGEGGHVGVWRAWTGWSGIGVSRVAIFLMDRLLLKENAVQRGKYMAAR